VASETGHVYTFATPKLQPIITTQEGKDLITKHLNAPSAAAATSSSPSFPPASPTVDASDETDDEDGNEDSQPPESSSGTVQLPRSLAPFTADTSGPSHRVMLHVQHSNQPALQTLAAPEDIGGDYWAPIKSTPLSPPPSGVNYPPLSALPPMQLLTSSALAPPTSAHSASSPGHFLPGPINLSSPAPNLRAQFPFSPPYVRF
jgi:hypothetical protein